MLNFLRLTLLVVPIVTSIFPRHRHHEPTIAISLVGVVPQDNGGMAGDMLVTRTTAEEFFLCTQEKMTSLLAQSLQCIMEMMAVPVVRVYCQATW